MQAFKQASKPTIAMVIQQPSQCSFSFSTFSDTRDQAVERKRKFEGTAMQTSDINATLLRFQIPDFASLSHERGNFVEPRPIRILNKSWHLRVYPRGHGMSRTDKTLVSCFLSASDEELPSLQRTSFESQSVDDFEFSFRIRNWRMVPKRCGFRSNMAYGFMGHSRENILENGLEDDGSLIVDVAVDFWAPQPQFVPWDSNKKQKRNAETLAMNNNLTTDLFRSLPYADLSFRVGSRVFQAHKCVLAIRARTLLELALGDESDDEALTAPVIIPSVEEDVFQAFLDYVYTSDQGRLREFLKNSSENNLGPILSLFKIADKFGANDLKDVLESVIANEHLSPVNCCEMILLADSHWCSNLKEKAMKLFCSNPMASIVRGPSGWKLLEESPKLLSELLACSNNRFFIGSSHHESEIHSNFSNIQKSTLGSLWDRLEVASYLRRQDVSFS